MQHASQDRQKKATGTGRLMVWSRQTLHWYCYYWIFSGIKFSADNWENIGFGVFFVFVFLSLLTIHVYVCLQGPWSAEGDMYIIPLYLISPHLYRCLRMSGAISLRWGKMTRFHAGGCAVAAISRPWLRRTAATRTAAPNPRPRSRHDEPATWRPRSRLSQRWLRSSECVPGRKLLLEITRCKDLDFS